MNAKKLDAIMEAVQQVEQDLRDYSWMAERAVFDNDCPSGRCKF